MTSPSPVCSVEPSLVPQEILRMPAPSPKRAPRSGRGPGTRIFEKLPVELCGGALAERQRQDILHAAGEGRK